MRKVTIEDISHRTGLSRGTVSRALNDRPDISNATKQRVLQACRELNYTPSHAARSLATGRHFAAAALIDDLHDPFATEFLRGAMAQASSAHYSIQLIELGRNDVERLDRIRTLADDRLDGVLIGSALAPAEAQLLRERIGQRIVTGAVPLDGAATDVFAVDQTEIGRLIGRFLMAAEGPAVYLHRPDANGAAERLTGFREIWNGDPATVRTISGEPDGLTTVLAPLASTVRAIAADDDHTAVAAMIVLAHAQRRAGDEAALIGVGNDAIGRIVAPALSSIDPGGAEAGRRAFDALRQRAAENREDRPVLTHVAPRFVARQSSRNVRFG